MARNNELHRQELEMHRKRRASRRMARHELTLIKAAANECGECQACCFVPAVEKLNKPVYTQCSHQCSAGCGIYGQHPAECQQYYCLWKANLLNSNAPELRPDRCGFIVELRPSPFGPFVQLWEVWPDAHLDEERLALVSHSFAHFRKGGEPFPVVCRLYGNHAVKFRCTPEFKVKLEAYLNREPIK